MALSTAAGAAPIFLNYNYINSFSDNLIYTSISPSLTATSAQSLVHRVYQMDPTAYWQGTLGADDTKTEIITCPLYIGSANGFQTIDSIFILKNNLNNFLLEYHDGTGWHTIANVTGNAGADYVNFLASSISADQIRLTMTTTTPANNQKLVGNLIATLSIFQPSKPMMKFTPKPRQQRRDVVLADGTIDYAYYYWSDNSYVLTDLDMEFDLMPTADLTNFNTLFTTNTPMIVYPEPGDVVRNMYLCTPAAKSYKYVYSSQYKTAGYKISMSWQNAGYF